mmetsp:Transcript_83992/g.271456  ORF Transcript_83992/g.271456 Transcript_83992/m.271456 type:complete len:913 (-) Transcript_83992:39-2777(-)
MAETRPASVEPLRPGTPSLGSPSGTSAGGSGESPLLRLRRSEQADASGLGSLAWHLARHVVDRPVAILVAWLLAAVVSCLFAPELLEAVRSCYRPEPAMPSFGAEQAVQRHFPELVRREVDTVLLELGAGVDIFEREDLLREATGGLDHLLADLRSSNPGLGIEVQSWRPGEGAGQASSSYIGRDERAYLMQVIFSGDAPRRGAAHALLEAVRSLDEALAPKGLALSCTGPHALEEATHAQARRDIGVHSVMFLPVAALIIHVHLRRLSLMPLPALCAAAAALTSFALELAVARRTAVDQNVPTLMAFLSISLCIDWSFFLLARFREEEESSFGVATHAELVHRALFRTGANVALSGLLIVACLACLALMPAAIASTAVGASLATVCSLLSCLTLLPALLVAFPGLFRRGSSIASSVQEWEALEEVSGGALCCTAGDDGGRPPTCDSSPSSPSAARPSNWLLWANVVTRFPLNLVVLLCAAAAFAATIPELMSYTPCVDDSLGLPPSAQALRAREKVRSDFAGRVPGRSQVYVLLESLECADGMKSVGAFNASCGIARGLLNLDGATGWLRASDLLGVAFYAAAPNASQLTCIPWRTHFDSYEEAGSAMAGNFTPSGHLLLTGTTRFITYFPLGVFAQYHALYQQLWSQLVSADGKAMLLVLQLPWNMISWRGFKLIQELRDLLDGLGGAAVGGGGACGEVVAWEVSAPGVWLDYVTASMDALPWALLAASLVAGVCLSGAFGSAVAAAKLLLTVVLPLAWVYAIAIWYFKREAVHTESSGGDGGLHWMVPCSTSMLLLALALDYNVFFFGRALEFRRQGLADLEAIRWGLATTGPVITSAGLIFALEFSGLLYSEAELSRQAGFVVAVGVLLDTFVVRSCVLPALLSIGARWNWGSVMPPSGKVFEGDEGL